MRDATSAGRRPGRIPRACRHGLPAGGSVAPAPLRQGRRTRRSSEIARACTATGGARRGASVRSRSRQRLCRVHRRVGWPPSTASSSCPTTASSTSTGTSPPVATSVVLRFGDVLVGPTICEDVWQPGPSGHRPRAGGRAAARQPLRLAVPRRQGRGARGDAGHPRAGQRRVHRLLQPRRRPGRAGLRRPFGRPRRRGRGGGAGARIRGGAARRRRRSDGGDRPPATGRAPPRARARRDEVVPVVAIGRAAGRTRASEPDRDRSAPFARRAGADAARARASGCATTWTRTASATSWSASRAGSTPRVTAALCVDALGAERVHTRVHALAVLVRRNARRRARGEREPRCRFPRDADRGRRGGVPRGARRPSRAWRPRTCRRASGARC